MSFRYHTHTHTVRERLTFLRPTEGRRRSERSRETIHPRREVEEGGEERRMEEERMMKRRGRERWG